VFATKTISLLIMYVFKEPNAVLTKKDQQITNVYVFKVSQILVEYALDVLKALFGAPLLADVFMFVGKILRILLLVRHALVTLVLDY
jgi:hypothetical protein